MTSPMVVGLTLAALFVGSFVKGLLDARRELKRKREGQPAPKATIRLDVESYKRRRSPRGNDGGRAA